MCHAQVCRALVDSGHSVTVVTGAPAGFFVRELPSPRLAVRKAQLDFGAKQKDAFSVDMAGAGVLCSSLMNKLDGAMLCILKSPARCPQCACRPSATTRVLTSLSWNGMQGQWRGTAELPGGRQRATLLETEQSWLAAVRPDLVVSDIVPLACAAAAGAGIPCVCVSNFSWGGPAHVHDCASQNSRQALLPGRCCRKCTQGSWLVWGSPCRTLPPCMDLCKIGNVWEISKLGCSQTGLPCLMRG